jgi:hypothetical protein
MSQQTATDLPLGSGTAPAALTIRLARAADTAALRRIAALDSAAVPAGRVVLGEVEGVLWAAVAVDGGAVVADPFRPTAEVVEVLRERARQLGADPLAARRGGTLRLLSRPGLAA